MVASNGSAYLSAALRQELSLRNRDYARKRGLSACESYGDPPVICYPPSEDETSHGNFLRESYRQIRANPQWTRRLAKVHTQARSSLPRIDRRWRELDSSNSSDALLMNIFCFPGTLKRPSLTRLLGIAAYTQPEFGVRARVPLANGRFDRTEIDMRIGDLLVEAKLTESDFQSAEQALVHSYRDLTEVFDLRGLPRDHGRFLSYQLIRNVLAAYAAQCSICLLADARRPDLREAWYQVMRCVRLVDLRLCCKMLTWQEVAGAVSPKLRSFLAEKYGILPE